MGLDTNHNAWHGPYSFFNEFRGLVCRAAGYGDLKFFWAGSNTEPPSEAHNLLYIGDPLLMLLSHADNEGRIMWQACHGLKVRLYEITPAFNKILKDEDFTEEDENYWRDKLSDFARGCKLAWSRQQDIDFH